MEGGGLSSQCMRASLMKNNKTNTNLLQIVVGCGCGESWPLVVVCGCFVSKMGQRKITMYQGIEQWQQESSQWIRCGFWWCLLQESCWQMETNQPWSHDVFCVVWWCGVCKWDLCKHDLIYLFLVMRVVFKAQPSYFISKQIGGNLLWWPPKRDLHYLNTMVFGDSIVRPTWVSVQSAANTILVVF